MIYAYVGISVHMQPLTSIQHFMVLFCVCTLHHGSGFIISSKVLFYDSCFSRLHALVIIIAMFLSSVFGMLFSKSWNSSRRCVNIRWKNVSLLFCEYIFCLSRAQIFVNDSRDLRKVSFRRS